MGTNDISDPWITDDFENNEDDFRGKKLMPEYSEQYGNSLLPVKSQADIILTEIEKQLASTESTYDEAKKRLSYSKFLYQTAGSVSLRSNDYNQIDESPLPEINSQSDISTNSPLNDDKISDKNLASGDTRYLDESKNSKNRAQVELETIEQSPVNTARSYRIESRSNIHREIQNKNSNLDDRNYFFEQTISGRGNFTYEEPRENLVADEDVIVNLEDNIINDISPRRQHSYQLNLAKYSKSLQDEFEEETRRAESSMIDDQELYELKSRHDKIIEPKFHLNISESVESVRASMKTKRSRNEKQRRVSSKIVSKQIDDSIGATSKRKRKKRNGVKTSNSRCTTATRDTSQSENKKDIKKRKQTGHSTIPSSHYSQNNRRNDVNIKKAQNNLSEVVEIYNNIAAKSGSLSVVSSKHSKLLEPRDRNLRTKNAIDQPTRIRGSYKLVESNNTDQSKRLHEDIDERRIAKQKNHHGDRSLEKCENDRQDDFQESNDHRSGEPKKTDKQIERHVDKDESKIIEEFENHRYSSCIKSADENFTFHDPLTTRNYELPTVASKLKEVNRSYFNRFNFRNIPFVVGTSVAPSYNLGLNIQEALSLIKTRQMMPGGVTQLLINKVTKGEIPVSTLLGTGRKDYSKELNIPCVPNYLGIPNIYLNDERVARSMKFETQIFQDLQETCGNGKIEITTKSGKTHSVCSSLKFNKPKNFDAPPEFTKSTLLRQRQEELNFGDSQSIKWQNMTNSTNGIREVILNFSDKYEAMLIKFEKLQEQAEKKKDKSLDNEIASLEKELTEKEKEIRAVVSLYQEVQALKHQMRMLHERNSLVCVSTESPGNSLYPQFSIRSKTLNPVRLINLYRSGGSCITRGPSTSTKLAGLLRQIKTFQKQFKSTK